MQDKPYFEYGEKETVALRARDSMLGKAIDEIGHIYRPVTPNLFMALIHAMIGQQISTKAQETIWARFLSLFAPVTPEHIASLPAEALQTCGISMKKALYIREMAGRVADGTLDLETLKTLPDAAVCEQLCRLKGIGVWTAEMLMIFSMQRMDILSRDDLAILRGLRMLYRHRKITPALFAKYKKRYAPYATVASLYLWQISQGVYGELTDPAPKKTPRKKIGTAK